MRNHPSSKQSGAALVEFGLMVTILFLLLAGTYEFGRAFAYYDAQSKATRDGARFMSVAKKTNISSSSVSTATDIVVAADTKAPNGHSDALFGHVASRDPDIITAIREWRKLSGSIPGPFEAWLVHRGLETLEVRFDRMCGSAEIIARRLKDHPGIRAVRFPGLEDDPSHNLACAQMERFGFLIGMTLGSESEAEAFIDGCALIQPATSFGGVHTSAERRARWGDAVAPGFVRLSVGCEPVEELWSAMQASLDRVPSD